MNIFFFTRSFYPHIGGVEKHILEIALQLIKKGHSVTVICEDEKKTLGSRNSSSNKKEIYQGIQIFRIPIFSSEGNKKFTIWSWLLEQRKLIKEADIVHAHDVSYWFFPLKVIYPRKKFYTTFHGYETVYPPRKRAILMRRLSKLLSYKTINIGEYIKKWYGTPADITLYGGVTLSTGNKTKEIKNNLSILFVGRIEEDNGVLVYEEVLNILDNNQIPYTFSALGDGKLQKTFQRFGGVHGFIKNTEEYIREADIIFASSYLSILEGFANKKTVMSVFQNPLKKDYLLMTPFSKWIVSSDEAMEIAHAVIAFTKKRESYKLQHEEAYDWVQQQDWEEITEKYLKLWVC